VLYVIAKSWFILFLNLFQNLYTIVTYLKRFFPVFVDCIPVNPPPLRGSLQRKSLISRMDWVSYAGDINLPHDLPPAKIISPDFEGPFRQLSKSSTIKSWPTFCDHYFWKFPIWNSCAEEKRREIRMVKVNVIFKLYPVIDLFDTFSGKLGHGD
jgi:hypothetical protein